MARSTHSVNVPSGARASRLSPLQVAGAGRRLARITQQRHTHTETPLYFSPFSRLLRTAPFSSLHGWWAVSTLWSFPALSTCPSVWNDRHAWTSLAVAVVQLCPTLLWPPWTIAHQAPLSMGFTRQEYWSRLPFPSPGNHLTQGSKSCLLNRQATTLPLSHQGNPSGFS